MSKTSKIWQHFIRDNGNATCKHCQKNLRHGGNTSNLHKHLRQHNIYVNDFKNNKASFSDLDEMLKSEMKSTSIKDPLLQDLVDSSLLDKELFRRPSISLELSDDYDAPSEDLTISNDDNPHRLTRNRNLSRITESAKRRAGIYSERRLKRDGDCNFLLSLLPVMKNMSEIQKLEFRSRVSNSALEIMKQPKTTADKACQVNSLRNHRNVDFGGSPVKNEERGCVQEIE